MTGTRTPIARRPDRKRLNSEKTPAAGADVRRLLLRWFDSYARPLPWREAGSAYAVWVSEVMLQQTQVSTVIPYYQRFMNRFPTVQRLAAAPLERVLELWSGLGYYRRARLMHQAAQEIVARFNGEFPAEYELARTLPGVGDYTARAVLSIAYQKPLFVLDGNVARVIARLRAMKGNVHQTSFRHSVEDNLQQLLSRRRPGDFNQAIMQLGQLVCLPRAPRCVICPLRRRCEANLLGAPVEFPEPRPRRAAERHFLAVAVLRRDGKVALVRGLDDGLLGDLWNFPAAFGRSRSNARAGLEQRLGNLFPAKARLGQRINEINHDITHRAIRADIYPAEFTRNEQDYPVNTRAQNNRRKRLPAGDGQRRMVRWLPLARMRYAAVPGLARKIAEILRAGDV